MVELREVKDNTVAFCWTSGFDGGSPITGYDLEYKALSGKKQIEYYINLSSILLTFSMLCQTKNI